MGHPTLKSTQGIAPTALIGPRTTIIVVFLVRAGRLSEVIMDDHRPTSSGRAGIAELEAGNARRESPGGADGAETPGVRTRPPGAGGHTRSGASSPGGRRRSVHRLRSRSRCHAPERGAPSASPASFTHPGLSRAFVTQR